MRPIAARVGAFLVVVALAGWPWQPVRRAFASAYCATVGAALASVNFRDGAGHARVMPAPPTTVRRPGENVTSDAEVELSVDGLSGHPRLGVNLRRDAYLPLLLLIGAIALAPLRMRSKAIALLVGLPIVLAASLAALAALVGWVFAGGLGPPDAMKSASLDVAVRMLLAPPGNRFIAPLVLAAVLILWRLRADRRSDRQRPSPPSVEPPSELPPSELPPSELPSATPAPSGPPAS
jgi:hypothetical protein